MNCFRLFFALAFGLCFLFIAILLTFKFKYYSEDDKHVVESESNVVIYKIRMQALKIPEI